MIKRHILHEEVQRERKDEVLEFLICRSQCNNRSHCIAIAFAIAIARFKKIKRGGN
jgi:hypothetical protein